MIEIRWHGRGGQGAFTASRLLAASASLYQGMYALAFPSFDPERRGAPVQALPKLMKRRSQIAVKSPALIILSYWIILSPMRKLQRVSKGKMASSF